nr:FecR domain-containing protein [Sphingobium sp. BYY-5]
MQGGNDPIVHATTEQPQVIALAGNGGTVMLDRNSQLAMGDDGRVRMDRGAAYFDVRHDEARPLEIRSGEFVVRDIGTRFTVTRAPGRLFVAVEEGIVDIGWRDSAPTRLTAGQAFQGEEKSGSAEIRAIDPGTVGSWRDDRLVYDNAPLDMVAVDLSRYMGTRVEVDPSIAKLKLSGILLIRNGSDLADQISAILPVEVRRGDGRVRLVGRGQR